MRKNRTWTDEECSFLEEKWGVFTIPTLAKILGRSIGAVKQKANRMGLGTHLENREEITFRNLLEALGYSRYNSYLVNRLRKLDFPFVYKASIKKKFRMVKIDEFWKWAEKNKCEINFAKFPKNALGKEPKWVDEKRRADLMNPSKVNPRRKWTKDEDRLLIEKVKSNRYTYQMLSRDLNRTECAISRRLLYLGVPYRPIPQDNHIKWTVEENLKMIELHKRGYDTNAISKILNKTQLSICSRLSNLNI